jgi:hypothetical protein
VQGVRTVDQILTDFSLHESAPRPLMEQRLHVLAAYIRDYERSYELLSQTLHRRTGMLREAEGQVVALAADNEARRIAAAKKEELMLAVLHWHTALGTDNEAQCMADLRETLTIYVHMEGGR